MHAIGRADLGDDPALARNDGRVKRVDEIDAAITAWTRTQSVEDALVVLKQAEVPSGRIYTVKDISEDPHYRARGVIESVTAASGLTVEVPGIMPKLSASPGAIHDRAPTLGEHTDSVLEAAGFDAATIADLRARGVVA